MGQEVKQSAIDFCLKNANEEEICLSSLKGKWIVLYFYPKDNTSGCTTEAITFTKFLEKFNKLNAVVIGISPDSCKSHQNFIKKHDLKILLLSDPEKKVIQKYDVWKLKKMYGKEYYGVERSTFLINPDFEICHEWRKVKVKGHVEEVLNKLKEFIEGEQIIKK